MNKREEILKATSEAASILAKFPAKERSGFDIVGAVADLGIPVLFRPLDGLWGATVTVGDGLSGIMVTTKLDLHVQRFTLAHELGHLLLGHKIQFDETIGFAGRLTKGSRPPEEVAADTFASELLGAKILILESARRHRWTGKALMDPRNVYQLSLRLGLSFKAAAWALAGHGILPESTAEAVQDETVKDLKLAIAPKQLITNSWANVWNLTKEDTGAFIEGGPDDLFAVDVHDNASAGYLWQLVDAGPHGKIVEERAGHSERIYGTPSSRTLFLRFTAPGVHQLVFEHRRPWSGHSIERIEIGIDSNGKEQVGLSRRTRAMLVGAA